MRCSQAGKRLSAYLDEELRAAERERLAAHLRGCEACRGRLAGLERVRALFRGVERPAAPAGFGARVLAAVRSPERSRPAFFPAAVRWSAQAALFALVLLAGVSSGRFLAASLAPGAGGSPAAFLSLDVFADTPPGSPGGVYLAMIEARHE